MSNTYSRLAANLPLIRANLCPLAFLGVPEQAYSRAILGVYELTRIELLRDLYLWAHECSTQEYLAIKQELTELDPMRLAWHQRIRETVRQVVLRADSPPLDVIRNSLTDLTSEEDQGEVADLIIEELRRLHEGVLARYRLRPAEFQHWRDVQGYR